MAPPNKPGETLVERLPRSRDPSRTVSRRLAFGLRPRDPDRNRPHPIGRGSDERSHHARYEGVQVGGNPADPSGRRAEGDRPGACTAPTITMPGMLYGKILRSPHAHARIRSIDTSKAASAARRQGGRDREGLAGPEVRVHRPRARRGEFLARHAQHHGAREGAVRGPCGRRGRRDQPADRRGGAGADRGRLRGAAARHRRRRGDEAGRAAAVRGHDHARRRAGADQAVQHLEAARIPDRRSRAGLRAGRRGGREGVQDRRGAPGLYRAACLRARASTPTARPRSGRRARAISWCAR